MPSPKPATEQNKGYRHPFFFGLQYLGGVGDSPRTLTELAICRLSAEIRTSPKWHINWRDPAWRDKWVEYATERVWRIKTSSSFADVVISAHQIRYVLDELKGYATLKDANNKCQVSCFERIWHSHELLDDALRNRFLEEIECRRDYARQMTESHEATLELVDPTLYPLIYNTTLVSQLNGRAFRPVQPPPSTDVYTVSPHFALLPSDVYVRGDGTVKILSYINNLHWASNKPIYAGIQHVLGRFIPLFEHCLTDLHRNNPLPQRIPGPCKYTVWDEPEPPEHSDDEDSWQAYEHEMRNWALQRPITLPDVSDKGYQGGLDYRRHRVSLRDRIVQVVVRVSETSLSIQAPDCPESVWHVEGMQNERIVASGFHCLTCENISETFIQFRMAVSCPRGFSAGDNGATLRTWGLGDGEPCHQYIGAVSIRDGLSIVFPNIYQHRQSGLKLQDPSKEGRLTMLWFYLIDPEVAPVVSTALVAPQQKEWIYDTLTETLRERLPQELIDTIMGHTKGLLTIDEAKQYQKQYTVARDQFTQFNSVYYFCVPFDAWSGPEGLI